MSGKEILLALKLGAKLAGIALAAKLKKNFRKWNRSKTGARDDGKAEK